MRYPDYCYVDTASGGAKNRNNIQDVRGLTWAENTDNHTTYFRYPEEFQQYFRRNNGSTAGYNGGAYSDIFPVDFDDRNTPELALRTAREFIRRLIDEGVNVEAFKFFFSGAKGFHVYIPSVMLGVAPGHNLGLVYRKMAQYLLGEWGIKYDDIYQLVHLIRLPNTINSNSGLYKIQLSRQEFENIKMSEILELARSSRPRFEVPAALINRFLSVLYRRSVEDVESRATIAGTPFDDSGIAPPRSAKLCYYELLKGVGEGYRDKAGIRLAGYFRKQGLQQDMTEAILLTWNARNIPPLKDAQVIEKAKGAYKETALVDFGCNDEILKAYCQRGCFCRQKKDGAEDSVQTYEQVEAEYELYAKEIKKRLCVLDIPDIGPAIRGIAPGEVLTILARQGVGKTALLINLLMRIGMGGEMWKMFFSMEQPSIQIWERMACIANGRKGTEIQKAFEMDDRTAQANIKKATRKLFNRVLFCEKSRLDVPQMIAAIKATEERIGKKIGLVAVDYLGRMAGHGDLYERASINAMGIKDLAKELDVAVILLSQASRKGGDGTTELDVDSGRDSGQIEEASDMLITLWRPEMKEKSTEPEEILRLKLAKNRKGAAPILTSLRFVKQFLRFDSFDGKMWLDTDEGKQPLGLKQEDEQELQPEPVEKEEKWLWDLEDDQVWGPIR